MADSNKHDLPHRRRPRPHGLPQDGFAELAALTRDDYLIVVGDLGAVFYPAQTEMMVNIYSYLPYTVLFVDGNHENFDELEKYEVTEWNGGRVHRISDNLIHLMRGQVFTIEGHRFLTFGGANSVDRYRRTEGVDWWPQELPTREDYDEAISNLGSVGFEVDYVLTHDCPTSLLETIRPYSSKLCDYGIEPAASNTMLENLMALVKFRKWYFGHYHIDEDLGRFQCLFYSVVPLERS